MNPVVRDAEEADHDDLVRIFGQADRVDVRLSAALSGEETMLVGALDDVVRGMLSIRWRGGCDGELPWLYGAEVEEGYRGLGLGTALWVAAERRCRRSGAQQSSLDVEVENVDARRLYERLGYEVVGRHRHHWRSIDPATGSVVAEGDSDTWAMRKRL
jgi:ribosomal protein S18 acetylase RimI-like enzyme